MNPVEADWLQTLNTELNNNMLLNSPKGKTAYACGLAYALDRLKKHCKQTEWEKLRKEAATFCDGYMRT